MTAFAARPPLDLWDRALALLPCCGPCSRPGPWPTYPTPDGSHFALCPRCRERVQAEAANERRERLSDVLHRSTSAGVPS